MNCNNSIAAGKYFATGKKPIVYLQNSGIGNIVNPIMSLCHEKVYGVPIILLIGWRGEPGLNDEPQHMTQGNKTLDFLKAMDINYEILTKDSVNLKEQLSNFFKISGERNHPSAILVRKNTFKSLNIKNEIEIIENAALPTRNEALKIVLENLDSNNIYVSTTGKLSRELYFLREKHDELHDKDFLNIGAMGHVSSIALGIALGSKQRKIICLDGDGSLIMHLGAIGAIGESECINFGHIVFNNGKHDSVGGQPTIADNIKIPNIAMSMQYNWSKRVNNINELNTVISLLNEIEGPWLLEIKIKQGEDKNLGRPKTTPQDSINAFKKNLQDG